MARRGAHPCSCVLLAATLSTGCEARMRSTRDIDLPAVPEREPLDLSVDRVDIAHGALRVSATMHEGSADVSVTLGDGCDGDEVGGGMATPSSFVWIFGEEDLAGALGCDLEVVARATTPTGYVLRTASLTVSAEIVPSASQQAAPLPSTSRSTLEMELVFAPEVGGRRLSVGDSLLEGTPEESEPPGPAPMRFALSHRDLARAILSRRPLRLGSWSAGPSVSIGGVALETEQVEVTDDSSEPGGEESEAAQGIAGPHIIRMRE